MGKELELVLYAAHVVALVPQRFKLLRHRKEARQFGLPQRIAPMFGHRRAEVGDKDGQHIVTSAETRAPRRMGEEQVDTVAVFRRNVVEIDAHQMSKAVIPRHDVEVRFLNAGGFRHQRIQQAARAFTDTLAADRLRRFTRRQPCQHKQVPGFGWGTLQRFCNSGHHRAGGIDVPTLLQPGVPGHPHVREHCHLFPAQTRRTASTAARQAKTLWIETFTTGT